MESNNAIKKIKQGFVIQNQWRGTAGSSLWGEVGGALQGWHCPWDLKDERHLSASSLWKNILISPLLFISFQVSGGEKPSVGCSSVVQTSRTSVGAECLREVAMYIHLVGPSCKSTFLRVTPCCPIFALCITVDILFLVALVFLASKPLSRWRPRVAQL